MFFPLLVMVEKQQSAGSKMWGYFTKDGDVVLSLPQSDLNKIDK